MTKPDNAEPLATINEGARRILDESVVLLDEHLAEVVIIGGWGTFLRNQGRHPGTKDVDILFPPHYSKELTANVITRFLDNGYMVSAKHGFQILKPLRVGMRTYLYNVDVLHPAIEKLDVMEFEDVINLDVTIDGTIVKTVQTAGVLRGDLVFAENLYEVDHVAKRSVRFLNDTGIVITKLKSACNPKRRRDIYDMVLSWEAGSSELALRLKELGDEYEIVSAWLREFALFASKNPDFFPEAVTEFSQPGENEKNCSALDEMIGFCAEF
jgi:hypothetical protein